MPPRRGALAVGCRALAHQAGSRRPETGVFQNARRQQGRTECGRLRYKCDMERSTEKVRLQLHQEWRRRPSTVDVDAPIRARPSDSRGLPHIRDLMRYSVKCSPRMCAHVVPAVSPGQCISTPKRIQHGY
jgi:hypothetical protein